MRRLAVLVLFAAFTATPALAVGEEPDTDLEQPPPTFVCLALGCPNQPPERPEDIAANTPTTTTTTVLVAEVISETAESPVTPRFTG